MVERQDSLIGAESESNEEWSLLSTNRRRRSNEGSIDLLKAYERELGDEPTDTVREYLRSIGQHALLTAPEELDLGLDVERWMLLKETRSQMTAELERDPTTIEVAATLIAATVRELLLLRTLGGETGLELPNEAPISVLLGDPDVREILDKPPTDTLKELLAGVSGDTPDESAPRLAALSRTSSLIPPDVFEVVERTLGAELYADLLDLAAVEAAIEGKDRRIEQWWSLITDRGQSASERLTNSNLRLVVSVARRYLRRGLPLLDLVQEGNLGPDAGRREVRPSPRVQVQHLRDLVDTPGGHKGTCRPGSGRSGCRCTSSSGCSSLIPLNDTSCATGTEIRPLRS